MSAVNTITDVTDPASGAKAVYLNGRLIHWSEGDVIFDRNSERAFFWGDLLEVLLTSNEFNNFDYVEMSAYQPIFEPDWYLESDPYGEWPDNLEGLISIDEVYPPEGETTYGTADNAVTDASSTKTIQV